MNMDQAPSPFNLPFATVDARIGRAVSLIEDHIGILADQRIALPVLGLEVAARELRQIGGAK